MPENPMVRMQQLLRELFQFDCQDLDFGVYRVLNYRRKQVEEFIGMRLPQVVDEAFAQYAAADKAAVERELEEKRHEIVASLGATAFDATGQLIMFRETPLGKQYIELEHKAKVGRVAEELKAGVYNDLYTFFSRYYEDGDIFSKPRRGKVEIPFTGHEDVVLHWANKDQYYIKTGEQFKTYRFAVDKQAVQFALKNAATEQNNNQREKRYFVLVEESPVAFDDKIRTLTVFFEYRPLTNAEKKDYGKTENQKPQDKLNAVAEEAILKRVKDATLKGRLAQPVGDGKPGLLRYHLNRFTKKNSTDFFIHKNLRGFLERELDDFLKTEVLRVDELLATGGTVAAQQLARGRVVREIAGQIIAFLAQIEDFQKKLFEKRKFVVRTEYCVTLDRLPESLWDDVLKNEAQLAEWRELYAITKKKPDKAFLKEHDKLVVDTRHFPESFKWQLLASFDDLDAALDGLLIKSENFQALALLLAKYRERVKCTYIDPPYNTGSDEFIYRDRYQHACWLAMMADRLRMGREFLCGDGALFVSIDDRELQRLWSLLESLYGAGNKVAQVTVRVKDPAGVGQQSVIFDICEYGLVFTRDYDCLRGWAETHPPFELTEVSEPLNGYRHWIVDYGKKKLVKEIERPGVGRIRIYSCTDYQIKDASSLAWERYLKHANDIYADYNPSGGMILAIRDQLPEEGLSCIEYVPLRGRSAGKLSTVYFLNARIMACAGAVLVVERNMAFRRSVLPNLWAVPNAALHMEGGVTLTSGKKPESLLYKVVSNLSAEHDLILDFFVGSGTAAAVAHKTRRRWLAIEGDNSVFPLAHKRLKLVLSGEESGISKQMKWQGGGFFKYHILEQYEDTLNNLELPRAKEGELALKQFGDEYLLRYMLDFETAGSASLLAVEQLRHPFDYRLKVQEGDEIAERPVDLVETFNYLLGLHVKKQREVRDPHNNPHPDPLPKGEGKRSEGGRRYRVTLGEARDGKSVVVVWRDTDGLESSKEALQRDRQFVEGEILPALLGKDAKPDRLLVNQPYAGEAEPIEPEFKRLMFAPIG